MGGMGFPMGGGMMGSPAPQGPFKSTYRCYPVVMMGQSKADLEKGDKIILPASALDTLARLRVTYPMMFSLVNPRSRRESRTHSGVMEFSAEEGQCYVPYWMMQNLLIESGGLLEVTNVSLRKGTYVKLQPHSVKFTQLHNPRVVSVTISPRGCGLKTWTKVDADLRFFLSTLLVSNAPCVTSPASPKAIRSRSSTAPRIFILM